MPFDSIKFLKDYNIPTRTEGPNCSKGWINICCPLPNHIDHNYHLGFNINKGYPVCWRCGGINLVKLISILLKTTYKESRRLIKRYNVHNKFKHFYSKEGYHLINSKTKAKLPDNLSSLSENHIRYLDKRNFDPEKLVWEFGLLGTGPFGYYKFRIIAPIYRNGKLISYQGRDVTGQAKLRYISCDKQNELIHYKNTLYNIDNAKTDKIILVEGITDVWRIGDGSIATFGTGYTNKQIIEIVSRFNHVFLLYDNEQEAQEKAEKLGWSLNGLGIKVDQIFDAFIDDPAKMKELEAKYLRKDLIGY